MRILLQMLYQHILNRNFKTENIALLYKAKNCLNMEDLKASVFCLKDKLSSRETFAIFANFEQISKSLTCKNNFCKNLRKLIPHEINFKGQLDKVETDLL